MEWIRKLPLLFLPIFILVYFLKEEDKKNLSQQHKLVARKTASIVLKKINHIQAPKLLSSSTSPALIQPNQDEMLKDRTPQSLQSDFEKDPDIIVSKGNSFLKDVAAISKASYSPKMGKILHEADGLVFFKSGPEHSFIPVAQNKMTKQLYPISSIVHIKGVNPAVRDAILGQGYSEHYYQPRIQFLSIKSEPSNILKIYTELRDKGYNAQLEVLTPHHKTFN